MKIKLFKRFFVFLFSTFGMLQVSVAQTGTYPDHAIKLIVPFAAGGYGDIVARILSDKLSKSLGESVVVLNKAGAGSTIGTEMVAKAPADGYTLGLISTTHVVTPWVYKKLPYDALKDFEPITNLIDGPYVLVVNSNFPAKNVKELVALAKAKPTTINFASSGNGSTQHLLGALLEQLAGIELTHVPYKGSAQALTDLLGGEVPMSFVGLPATLPHIKAGKLRALGITGVHRNKNLPDVPTMEEAGIKGYTVTPWMGVIAPAGTPKNIITKLQKAAAQGYSEPDAVEKLEAAGLALNLSKDSDDFKRLIYSEYDVWGKIVKKAEAKAD